LGNRRAIRQPSHGIHSANEYLRGDAHTNTVEGYFSILKRGIYGVYQHVSEHQLKRYLVGFDFRYNERIALGTDDQERTTRASRSHREAASIQVTR
jgi:hypothetical protein